MIACGVQIRSAVLIEKRCVACQIPLKVAVLTTHSSFGLTIFISACSVSLRLRLCGDYERGLQLRGQILQRESLHDSEGDTHTFTV